MSSPALTEAARLMKKRRGLPRNLRATLRLLWVMPAIVVFRFLRAFGFEIAIYPDQFGHQALDVEHHLRSSKASRNRCFYFCSQLIPNRFLYEKHLSLLTIIKLPRRTMTYLRNAEKANIRSFGQALFFTRGLAEKMADTKLWNTTNPQIVFSPEEDRRGILILEKLGIAPGTYVCFHARDSAYALAAYPKMWAERRSLSAGNEGEVLPLVQSFEENKYNVFRSSRFADFDKALVALSQRGLIGVRLGAKVERDYTDALPNLIDYAARHREDLGAEADFADVYLMAHCRFYVGTASGVSALSWIFNRLMVFVNDFPWPWDQLPPIAGSIYMQKLWRRRDGRKFTFREMIDLSRRVDWRAMYDNDFFVKEDLTVIDNTSEEIADAIAEMCDRIDGRWAADADDEARHRALVELADPTLPLSQSPARMARGFLLRHQDLLS
jgi:putative glycosyltransferase (TIGR04372 family)